MHFLHHRLGIEQTSDHLCDFRFWKQGDFREAGIAILALASSAGIAHDRCNFSTP
jgi:hypothetical protein